MNTLKTALLSFGLLSGIASFAQEKQVLSPHEMKNEERKITPEQKSARQTEMLTQQLLLTPEQKAKVLELNTGINMKDEGVRSNTALAPDQKKAAFQGNNNARREQMKIILTPEQYEKYLVIETKTQHREEYIQREAPKPVAEEVEK
jgi:Spy/CpxP family protein refolding chaperone